MKIREKIIRRLGGVPISNAGLNIPAGYDLKPVETEISLNTTGLKVRVVYDAIPEKKKREGRHE